MTDGHAPRKRAHELVRLVASIEAKHSRSAYCARPGCTRRCVFRASGRGAQPRFCSSRCRLKTHRERHELSDALASLEYAIDALTFRPESAGDADALVQAERARRFLTWRLQQYPQGRPEDSRRGYARKSIDAQDSEVDEDDADWVVSAKPGEPPRLPLETLLARMKGRPLNLIQLGQIEALDILLRREQLVRARWHRTPPYPGDVSAPPGTQVPDVPRSSSSGSG